MIFNLLLTLLNLVFFLNGFCPFRYNHLNNNTINFERNDNLNIKGFDRTILMIVDALRLDFLTKDYMPLTSELIEQHGCFMDVKVASPTVTLPRIKALTTGSIPQFVDIFYNLGNPQYVDDSLLHSVHKQNKSIVFFGDDTWLKVFPKIFHRQEGTSSFFVTDFYEVDDNVTRHVNSELRKEDWDMMILHYLGLDHIGHVHGPYSPLVPTKLKEMDDIFFKLFQEASKMKGHSLLFLTGDHGMKDSGGHGSSSYSEVHVPLVILGTPCKNDSIDQVDIAANLAILLNLDIPSASIGKLNRNFLNNLTFEEYLSALNYNAKILGAKSDVCRDKFVLASKFYRSYFNTGEIDIALEAIKLYEECSVELISIFIKSSVNQNFASMLVSVIFVLYLFLLSLNNFQVFEKHSHTYTFHILLLLIRIYLHEYYALFVGILVLSFQSVRTLNILNTFNYYKCTNAIIIFIIFLQPFTWLSSSFIEEEQEYWYFFLNSFFVFHLLLSVTKRNHSSFKCWLLIAISFRFAQTLNQTGDKWASLPDTSDFLMKPENYISSSMLLTISVVLIYLSHFRNYLFLLENLILILIYVFKLEILNQIFIARIIYLFIFINLMVNKRFINFWILLVSLVSKSHNLCMIPLSIYASRQILKEYGTSVISITTHLILGKSLFFMQGNGNSLASVDVTVGYIGLNSFQPIIVGIQLLVNIYSLTILIHLLLIKDSLERKSHILKILYVERLHSMIITCLISLIFRYHISVWTIYAPKLFIEFFHTVIFFVEVIIYYLVMSLKGSSNSKSTGLI